MRFSVLGPLAVVDDLGVRVGIGGSKRRDLLLRLLIDANRVLPTAVLIEDLWRGDPPPGAEATLQSHVSHLRKPLGAGRLVGDSGGYRLVADRHELVAAVFEDQLGEGRRLIESGQPAAAEVVLAEALAHWHGNALSEVADAEWAQHEAARLEDLRLLASELLLDAQLALGRHGEVASRAEMMVALHPLRERLWALLITALYRDGRQADALRAYGRLRSLLVEELGIEPSAELRQLERHILTQDPTIEAHVSRSEPDNVGSSSRSECPPLRAKEWGSVRDGSMLDQRAPIRYANAGGVSIAYRVMGEGPLDLVWVPGLASNLEIDFESSSWCRLVQRLASFSRVMIFDKRGMGLSDRNVGAPTLEERMDDVRAVMDAVGSERAALIGDSEGGPMSVLFAATYPQRTVALVLYGAAARARRDVDYPLGNETAFVEIHRILDDGGWGTGEGLRLFAPSLLGNERVREWFGRVERAAGSPNTIRAIVDTLADIDVRAVLPTVSAPTLVLHATDDVTMPVANGRWLAEHICGARFVELPGEHLTAHTGERFADEVESFLTGRRHAVATDRVLSTLLFSDIVGSTRHAAAIGDRHWTELLDQHDAIVNRQLDIHRGKLVKATGDGVLATFDGPARAIACGCELRDSLRPLGLDVRVGLHTGEIELRGADIGGIAVHIGARIAGVAHAGEVLVSRTVTDLVAGSGIEFADHGIHQLDGVPGDWQLFAVSGT